MAAAGGREGAPVAPPDAGPLGERPQAFAFFQAVRLLGQLFPDREEVGGFADPAREVVRFGANPAIGFPASEIHTLDLSTRPPRMLVNFLGLIGPLGVLPYHYSLLVSERARAGEDEDRGAQGGGEAGRTQEARAGSGANAANAAVAHQRGERSKTNKTGTPS